MVLNGTKRFQLHQYSITHYIFLKKKKKKNSLYSFKSQINYLLVFFLNFFMGIIY